MNLSHITTLMTALLLAYLVSAALHSNEHPQMIKDDIALSVDQSTIQDIANP